MNQEQASTPDADGYSEEHYDSFSEAFDFTGDDLAANRQGDITERQRTLLERTGKSISGCSLPMAIGGVLFAAGLWGILSLWLFSNDATSRELMSNSVEQVLLIGTLLVPAGAMVGAHLWTRGATGGFRYSKLLRAEGEAKLYAVVTKSGPTDASRLKLGDARFTLNGQFAELFEEGTAYRVYYVKSGPYWRILSAEPLKDAG